MTTPTDIISAPVPEFCRLTGLGTTTVYDLMNRGELLSVKVGKRRLVLIESWRKYIERNLGTPAEAPAASPPRRTRRSTWRA